MESIKNEHIINSHKTGGTKSAVQLLQDQYTDRLIPPQRTLLHIVQRSLKRYKTIKKSKGRALHETNLSEFHNRTLDLPQCDEATPVKTRKRAHCDVSATCTSCIANSDAAESMAKEVNTGCKEGNAFKQVLEIINGRSKYKKLIYYKCSEMSIVNNREQKIE